MSSSSSALTGLQQLLADKSRVVVLDGGFATELEKDPRVDLSASSLWSASLLLEKNAHLQSVVVDAHKTYFLAGADVATTASYQASVDGFKREGVTAIEDVEKLFAKSIDLGVQARRGLERAGPDQAHQAAGGRQHRLLRRRAGRRIGESRSKIWITCCD